MFVIQVNEAMTLNIGFPVKTMNTNRIEMTVFINNINGKIGLTACVESIVPGHPVVVPGHPVVVLQISQAYLEPYFIHMY